MNRLVAVLWIACWLVIAASDVHTKRPANLNGETYGWGLVFVIGCFVVVSVTLGYFAGREDNQ